MLSFFSTMASSATTLAPLPAERFYRTALFFLVLDSVVTLVSTGKLDPFTTVLVPAIILYKGFRWWRGYPAEMRQSVATRIVLAYVFVLPFDALFVSRGLASNSSNPALYSALLASVHFLLIVTIVRLYSATTDRDATFLAMLSFSGVLASAVFTVDTYFLGLFFAFLVFAVATFVGLEVRRGAAGAITPPLQADPLRERRFYRALTLATLSVALGGIILGSILFFFFPRFNAGFLSSAGLQTTFMSGFTNSVELGEIGEIKKDSTVVMRVKTGSQVRYPMLRWRGIALTTFDGHRWFSNAGPKEKVYPSGTGWIIINPQVSMEASPPSTSVSPCSCSPWPQTRSSHPPISSPFTLLSLALLRATVLTFTAATFCAIPPAPSSIRSAILYRSSTRLNRFSPLFSPTSLASLPPTIPTRCARRISSFLTRSTRAFPNSLTRLPAQRTIPTTEPSLSSITSVAISPTP